MRRSGDLEARLKDSLEAKVYIGPTEKPFFVVIRPPDVATVCDDTKGGEAQVDFAIPEGCTCIQWTFNAGMFGFLRGKKNADGSFLIRRPDGGIEAHIVECKATLAQSTWGDVTEQMHWTLLRLMALAGALDLEIDAVTLYTAYRRDLLSEKAAVDPAVIKRPLTTAEDPTPAEEEHNRARRQQLAWQRDQVRLRGFEGIFKHHKIPLDPTTGTAASAFSSHPANP